MELKVTVKGQEKSKNWRDLPIGTVYKNKKGVVFIRGDDLIILRYTSGDIWLAKADLSEEHCGWYSPAEVLGMLTEIIVQKADC